MIFNNPTPEGWKLAEEAAWADTAILFGEGKMPSLSSVDFSDFAAIKLAPGRPSGATSWKDADGNTVVQDPITKAWRLKKAANQSKPASSRQSASRGDVGESIFSEEVKRKAEEMKNKNKQQQKPPMDKDKLAHINEMVEALMAGKTKKSSGAGANTLNRSELRTFLAYVEGKGPETPYTDLSSDEIDKALLQLKSRSKSPAEWTKFVKSLANKGAPPTKLKTTARGRAVFEHFLATGGTCSVTGNKLPFDRMQMDHIVPLKAGGEDIPSNWVFMEAKFNQFKHALDDQNKLKSKLEKELAKSPAQRKIEAERNKLTRFSRKTYYSFFKRNKGIEALSVEDIEEAQGVLGIQFLKAIAETAGVSAYRANAHINASRHRGNQLPIGELKNRLLAKINPKHRNQLEPEKAKRMEEVKSLVRKKQEELDLLRKSLRSRSKSRPQVESDYSDTKVVYQGKVLGRCPAGTTRSGKTCIAGAQKEVKAPGYRGQKDLGGVSRQQIRALAKAKSTEDIIKAHKK